MSKKRYPPRIPRTAHGFRAQDLRAVPRGAWWVRNWLLSIERMRLGPRAGRGRMYAECGQVTSLAVSGSHVEATALGSRPDPYSVKIDFAPLPEAASRGFVSGIGMMSAARILAGDMPTVVDEVFSVNGAALYPTLGVDRFWCSCPDWSKPCKHIAAVLYLIGDVLVRDPGLLLRLRGVNIIGENCSCEALPAWKGAERLRDAIDRIRRRVGCM